MLSIGRDCPIVKFTVPGQPRPWQRTTKGRHTPAQMRAEQRGIRYIALAAMRGQSPHRGPIRLNFQAYFEIPSRWPAWERRLAEAGLRLPTGVPDLDNLVKLVMDAMSGTVYHDDAQVIGYDGATGKYYGNPPRIEVAVSLLPWISSRAAAEAWEHEHALEAADA